jgi:hypothetical protein
MKYRIIAAVAAAVAVAALGAAAAHASTSAQNYLAGISCTNNGVTFVSSGGFENGKKRCGNAAGNLGTAAQLCVDGTTFLYALADPNDPGVSDLVSYLIDTFEASASVGACSSGNGPANPGAAPAPPPSYFLCYSAYQTTPGVWPKDIALQLLQQGYWLAYAVSGNTAGGTNLGGFHLVCNLASTQAVDGQFVGGDGTVLGSVYSGVQGLYPQIGG